MKLNLIVLTNELLEKPLTHSLEVHMFSQMQFLREKKTTQKKLNNLFGISQ